MAIERITDFRAQCIARAQAGWLEPERPAQLQDSVPDPFDRRRLCDHFESILPGVTGARDPNVATGKPDFRSLVFFQVGNLANLGAAERRPRKAVVDELGHARSLDCGRAELV